jgi:hypothetical protein
LRALGGELLTPVRRESVELRPPPFRRHAPVALDPAAVLEPVERGVKRPLVHLEDVAGPLADALGDAPAVQRAERHRLEDEQVERALEQVGAFFVGHRSGGDA